MNILNNQTLHKYNRIDKCIILYYLHKSNIPVNSKSYRYIKLLLRYSSFRNISLEGMAKFNFRFLKFARKVNELNLYTDNFLDFLYSMNMEFYRRSLLSDIGLPKVSLANYKYNFHLDGLSEEYSILLINNLNLFIFTDRVTILNLRVFEDIVLDFIKDRFNKGELCFYIEKSLTLFKSLYDIYINQIIKEDDF